jgi:hypothetical protein
LYTGTTSLSFSASLSEGNVARDDSQDIDIALLNQNELNQNEQNELNQNALNLN